LREFLEFLHKGRELGYGTRAQIISVGKAPGKDDTIGVIQVMVFMPEIKSILGVDVFENMKSVMVAIGTGENNNTESQFI